MKDKIENIIEEYFKDTPFFKVSFSLTSNNNASKIELTIDGDQIVSLEDCSKINRELFKEIEDSGLLKNFDMEVISAGIGEPLKFKRQYFKNKGRSLSFFLSDGTTKNGILKEVKENSVIIQENQLTNKKANKKKTQLKETELFFDQIKKAKVEVSFS